MHKTEDKKGHSDPLYDASWRSNNIKKIQVFLYILNKCRYEHRIMSGNAYKNNKEMEV